MEDETTQVRGMERKSSIDKEPRTLSLSQVQFAREVAQCVVNTRSPEEAFIVFTEGLIPVVSCGSNDHEEDRRSIMEFDREEKEFKKSSHNLLHRTIASAPF